MSHLVQQRRPWRAAPVSALVLAGLTVAGLAGVPTPTASAAPVASASPGRNTAPLAPRSLMVGDRVAPLAIDGPPQFGWLPQDADPDEVQQAYEIVLSRGGKRVWDSGRVASSEQSWVTYDGPDLRPGTSYEWTVRTWDGSGAASPYAPPATFGTGLGEGPGQGRTRPVLSRPALPRLTRG